MMDDDSFWIFLFWTGGGENDGRGKLGGGEKLELGGGQILLKWVCSGVKEIETGRLYEGGE